MPPGRKRELLLKVLLPPLIAATVALILFKTNYLATYENRLYDLHYLLRGNIPSTQNDVVIVAIDDASLQREGAWPWPRERFARLISRIKEGRPRAFGLDILVDLPENISGSREGRASRAGVRDGRGDSALALALTASSPTAILPMVLGRIGPEGERPVLIAPLPGFVSDHSRPAVVNIDPDATDARVRRFRPHPGDGYVSFPVALILAADGLDLSAVTVGDDDIRVGKRTIPLVDGEAMINYSGSRVDAISAADVMEDFLDPALFFEDRIVLVGRTDQACKDFMNTPVPGPKLLETENLAGVEIWKEALDTILQDRALQSPSLPPILLGILLAAIVLSSLMLAAPGLSSIFLILFLGAWLVITHVAFRFGNTRIPVMPGVMTFYFTSILSFIRLFLVQSRLKKLLTTAFESYVSPHVLSRILDHRIELAVGGERKSLTILFADIQGFTAYSEEQPAEDVVAYLRQYFAEMNRVILDHEGIIDKLMGDGILAFFGDMDEPGNHALQAVSAALEMQQRMKELVAQGGPDLKIRVGINTGPVVVGNVGSERHFEYTVIGRTVNFAQRLEGACDPGGIYVAESTWEMIRDSVEASEPIPLSLKGITAGVTARLIRGLKPSA